MPAQVRNPDQNWIRSGTTLKPTVSGDNIETTGSGTFDILNQTTPSTFRAYLGTNQIVPRVTFTKLQINTEVWDIKGEYDNVTNYRFTPTTEGYYFIVIGGQFATGMTNGYFANVAIYKNGVRHTDGKKHAGHTGSIHAETSDVVFLNGSTDYVEFYVYHNNPANCTLWAGTYYTYFSGHKLS